MKIFLHEIKEQTTDLFFTEADDWVLKAVQQVDEQIEDSPRPPQSRQVQTQFSLQRVDDVFVVSGKIETTLFLLCSRCAAPFQYPCKPHFSALFCKDPVMAGIGHLQREGKDQRGAARPAGQNHGFARHAHDEEEGEAVSSGKDLDITYLSHDYISLGDVLTEQLQLQVPFQPLCKETCKGICAQCGTDLNFGRCACAKIGTRKPFSVLSDFKTE